MTVSTFMAVIIKLQNRFLLWLIAVNVLFLISLYNPVSAQTGAPFISYTTPNVYLLGAPMTPLIPTNTGGQVDSYTITGVSSSLMLPDGLTFDPVTGILSGTPGKVTGDLEYTVTARNSSGQSTFDFTIRIIPTPVYLIKPSDMTICDPPFDPGAFSIRPVMYRTGDENIAKVVGNLVHLTGIGTVDLIAYDDQGNEDIRKLVVSDYEPPLILSVASDKSVLCPGANATITVRTSGAGRNPTFEWFLNGRLIVKNDSRTYTAVNPSLNDKFTVIVTNNDVCYPLISLESDPVVLNPVPTPPTTSITVNPAGLSCPGTMLTFTAVTVGATTSNAPLPKWYVNDKDAGSTQAVFASDKLKNGDVVKYVLPFTNPCGPTQAATSNSIVVEYRKPELCNILPPTAFSPNGDGINDTWNIEYLVGFPECHVRVFSRHGQKLYDSIGYTTPWDGKHNGESLPSGTYYYVIALEKDMETVSGSITIIK